MMESRLILGVVVILALVIEGGKSQLDVCGMAPLNKNNERIVGGADAKAGAWPWQAYVRRDFSVSGEDFYEACGGSLISNMWILSAAHCFPDSSTSCVRVFLGVDSLHISPNVIERYVSQIIIHPDYNNKTNDHDIALLQLSSLVEFTKYITPVCLAAHGSIFTDGTITWVTGWGNIHDYVPLPAPGMLQEVDLPVVSNAQCNIGYQMSILNQSITDNMICAGHSQGGKDACQGDSGGPMVVQQDTRWIQAGIVSFGLGCSSNDKFPGVYARVSQYQAWINNHTSNRTGFIPYIHCYNSSNVPSGRSNLFYLSISLLVSIFSL